MAKTKVSAHQRILKGWRKIRDDNFAIEWQSLKDGHITRVHKSLDSGKSHIWFVSYLSNRGISRRFYHTKKAAEDFAKEWMKSRPKG